MAHNLSDQLLEIAAPIFLERITESCTSGSPAPSYADLMAYALDRGCRVRSAAVPTVLKTLEDAGRIERIGERNLMIYRLPTGEESLRRPQLPHESIPKGPTLEERARMWGVPLQLSHRSARFPFNPDPRYSAFVTIRPEGATAR